MFRENNRLQLTKGSDCSVVYEWTDSAKTPVDMTGAIVSAELLDTSSGMSIAVKAEFLEAKIGRWRVLIKGRLTESLEKGKYLLRSRVRTAAGETKIFFSRRGSRVMSDQIIISTDEYIVTIRSEGVQGVQGAKGEPGSGAQEIRDELDRIIDLSLLFDNALI